MQTHLLFVAFVAIAVYAQSVTGFALALILLGLVGLFELVPLPDAANAVSVLTIVNAVMFFMRRGTPRVERAVVPAIATNLVGTMVGMGLLTFLAANAYEVLRMVFGICILLCALLLWRVAEPYAQPSGARYFAFAGSLSGLLGGLFATGGPPLVYAVYRQPWPLARMQESLIFVFGIGAMLRLVFMVATGQFSAQAVWLAAEAVPVVLAVTAFSATRPPPLPLVAMKGMVCLFLICSGTGMFLSSLYAVTGWFPVVG